MIIVHLVKAVAAEVRRAVKRYKLPLEGEDEPRTVTVYEQTVPEEIFSESYEGEYHPYILVAFDGLEEDNRSEADISITFSTYGLSHIETATDGTKYRVEPWIDLVNLIDTVRLELLAHQLLDSHFRLLKPLSVEIPAVQPTPYWEGGMSARYLIYQPQEEISCTRRRIH